MRSLQRFLAGCGVIFALFATCLFAIGLSAQWGDALPFDVLGLIPFLRNLGHLFTYLWGAIFASAAIGCWVKALTLPE